MGKIEEFNRCIYCFAKKENHKAKCPVCGYENGICNLPPWWLTPGSLLKGFYMVGKAIAEKEDELIYLGWDLKRNCQIEIAEYFPKENVTRDITVSDKVNCIPGHEDAFEEGKQKFFKKAQLFYKCVTRVRELDMDFFVRNETCYYVRDREQRKGREYEK